MFAFKDKNAANRVHSIGYAQNSTDSHRVNSIGIILQLIGLDKNCQNLKESSIKNRPTSSSSSFMYINPLVGVGQRFHQLDEDIPEEQRGKTGKGKGTKARRGGKRKKKVIRCDRMGTMNKVSLSVS